MSVNQSQVPELMKLGQIPTDLEQRVDTDVLEPVVFSQSFCRFQLQNKGFLHSFSSIVLALDAPAVAANRNATLPVNVGIHSLIERATLKVGAQTICEIEDFANYMGYKSMFIDNAINQERESVISGRIMAHQLVYDTTSDTNAKTYTLDTNNYPLNDKTVPTGARLPSYSSSASFNEDGIPPKDNLILHNTPELRVSLADLFPFLRFNQLPLYMINEPISIELVWTPQSSDRRFCFPENGSTTERLDITQSAVKLVADYIYYDGDTMSSFADANKEMNFNYVDYRLAKRTYDRTSTTKQILNVGGAGRIVNKVFMAMGLSDTGDSLLNDYIARGPTISGSNQGQLTYNVRYNDHFVYPIDRKSSAIQFHDIVQTEGNVPYITREEFVASGITGENGILSNQTRAAYNGHSPSTDLTNRFNYQATRLNRNERVNSRGIEVETTLSNAVGGGTDPTLRVWIELVRSATLNNGRMDVFYA